VTLCSVKPAVRAGWGSLDALGSMRLRPHRLGPPFVIRRAGMLDGDWRASPPVASPLLSSSSLPRDVHDASRATALHPP